MALGESRLTIERLLERELTRAGEGSLEPAQAQRLSRAVALAIEENNLKVELQIRQSLQVAGLHV